MPINRGGGERITCIFDIPRNTEAEIGTPEHQMTCQQGNSNHEHKM
jgi:hypothetical protein